MAASDPASVPDWERRFRAPNVGFPHWPRRAPDRLAVASNESGSWQVYAWDRATGSRRQVTDHPLGVTSGACTRDGEGVVWFHDTTGDEVGHWLVEDFGGGRRRPLLPGLADAWSTGLAIGDGIVVAGTAADDGFRVVVSEGGEPPRPLRRHPETIDVMGLSCDSTLVALQHAEHGDNLHLAVRVLDARTGEVAGEQWDGPGRGVAAEAWSPVGGDQRLVISHEGDGWHRPAMWDLTTGDRRDLPTGLPGDVMVADWWPDASALLLIHDHEGRQQLFRFELTTEELSVLDHPPGTVWDAGVRPDGEVWFRFASGAHAASICNLAGEVVYAPDGERAPDGQPYRSWWFSGDDGRRLHGFVVTPPTAKPHPVAMLVHGGPNMAVTDTFSPEVQAWVDHGFAVAMVNYRGSTGYGMEFRDALIGDPGFPEVADVVCGLDRLVEDGVADPNRAVAAGGSWGGYITLLALGLHPDRWAAGVAAVPVGDYVTAYEEEAPTLQAFDRSLFGGSPAEVGALYRERSPLTYADRVRAPVLVLAGDNDSRCPIGQVLSYVEALRARGHDVELYRFDAGHGTLVIEERIHQMREELRFALSRLAPS
ncbi:MAG: prolyl oligopeptidase family serine peptidase [Actinomycetota bacterium]|nr:prolyl oligopeptidase family serine peptidase [Actinomycetota bacterium]